MLNAIRYFVDVTTRGLRGKQTELDSDALVALGLSKREVTELLAKLSFTKSVPNFDLDLSTAKSAAYFERRNPDNVSL